MAKLIRIPPGLHCADLVRRLPRNANFRDRTGEKANGCTVLGYAGIRKTFSAWLCRCQCGNVFIASSAHLNHRSTSCGCLRSAHKLSNAPIYHVWHRMIQQCYNTGHRAYRKYGGQGVKVCKRWRDSIQRFVADMGPCPRGHVLDRIKTTGDFTPVNCRWVTRRSRMESSGRRLVIEHNGERLGVEEWAERLGMTRQTLHYRVQRCREVGGDLSEAVATPMRGRMPCTKAKKRGRC